MIEPKQIIRTKRRSIALVVNSEGELIVRAPNVVSDAEIIKFVEKKQGWLEKKCFSVKAFDEKYSMITMADGDTVVYLGNDYMIDVCDVKIITIDGNKICVPNTEGSRQLLINWLKENAFNIFVEQTRKYSLLMGVSPKGIKITEAKSRWGSCSQTNNLNFAWRLVMCPISVIDYVIVHELSHIAFKNHSKLFWIRVKTVLPNYKEQQAWLIANRKLMEII